MLGFYVAFWSLWGCFLFGSVSVSLGFSRDAVARPMFGVGQQRAALLLVFVLCPAEGNGAKKPGKREECGECCARPSCGPCKGAEVAQEPRHAQSIGCKHSLLIALPWELKGKKEIVGAKQKQSDFCVFGKEQGWFGSVQNPTIPNYNAL